MNSTIMRLEEAIAEYRVNATACPEGTELASAAGEAIGVLKTYGNFNVKSLMYDMARLAAAAGSVPDDFEEKAGNGALADVSMW